MTIFNNTESEWRRLDWTILREGSTSVYWRQSILEEDIEWFAKENYRLARFDFSQWRDDSHYHRDMYDKLKLPDYYGLNYDSLDEGLGDIAIDGTGLVIVFGHFDILDKNKRRILMEIFDRASRFRLLTGERMIILFQVDDPTIVFEPVQTYDLKWNRREWFNADRKVG